MPKSSSGDLYWIENKFVMVNMYLKKVKKRIFTTLCQYTVGSEKLFCMSSNLFESMSPRRDFAYNSKWSSYAPV